MTEFNLSEKIAIIYEVSPSGETWTYYAHKDVKEFIRLLKEEFRELSYKDEEWISQSLDTIEDRIDKLAGEKLK